MIEDLKLVLAVLAFCVGAFLAVDLFITGFDFLVLLSAIGCFALAHFAKPKSTDDDPHWRYMVAEFIIDIPFKAISGVIRLAGKSSKGDFDIGDI